MLEHIKAEFFKKQLLLFLNEKRKLQLIKYNKNFQNKMGINIINYRTLSGRYIIYESKNKGKEYTSIGNTLIFEGEYLHGERNGYGKEITFFFVSNNIQDDDAQFFENNGNTYEGEYANGKRHGKGREFRYDGKLVFEGEYLNGERNGKGKELNWDGKLKYEGTYLKGKKNGEGKEYYENGLLKYEGKYLNGFKWEGRGFNINGDALYEIKEGKGFIKDYDFTGRLIFEGDNMNGKGKIYYGNRLVYEGEYLNGKKMEKEKNIIRMVFYLLKVYI